MLTEVAPDLFTATDTLRLPGLALPVRMTVVRLPGGEVAVISPTKATPALLEAVATLGPVRHVLAPSLQHHLFVRPWLDRFPHARAHGAPGLPAKRPEVPWVGELGHLALPGLQSILVAGAPSLNEVVFLHEPSRSLMVSDLLFHMIGPHGLGTRLILTLAGTRDRLAMSRVWRFITRDRAALAASLERILAWDFVRILPGHGEIFTAADPAATRAAARAALAWGLRV